MKKCPNCGAQVADDSRFCTECGKEFPQGNVCPHCGASVNEGDSFCQNCGKKLDGEVQEETYEQEESSSKRILPTFLCILLALALIGGGWYGYKQYSVYSAEKQAREQFVKDSLEQVRQDSIKLAEQERLNEIKKQEIQAKKEFLNKFYNNWTADEDGSDYSYVKKHITANALKVLKDEYAYDCDGECLATWLFSYEAGGDEGRELSRKITEKNENDFIVEINYEYAIYRVLLSVIKVGDDYKIDNIGEHSQTEK